MVTSKRAFRHRRALAARSATVPFDPSDNLTLPPRGDNLSCVQPPGISTQTQRD